MGERATHAPPSAGCVRADAAAPSLMTLASRSRRYAGCDVYGLAASTATVGRAGGEQLGQRQGPLHACFVRTHTAAGTAAPARLRQARPAQAAAQPAPRTAGGRPLVHGQWGGGAGRSPACDPGAVPLWPLRGARVAERRSGAPAAFLVALTARGGAPFKTPPGRQGGLLQGARGAAYMQPPR